MSGTDTRARAKKKTELPVFVTAENRSKLIEIYDEALRHWPVPFGTSFVATRSKTTTTSSSSWSQLPLELVTQEV
jgi:hypothetical protein